MACSMRSDEPHSCHGLRTDHCYDCGEQRTKPNRDKQKKKSGLDTPAKKQVQTAKKTPPSN